jgi:ethanolamine ammonia-lyase small subunit
MTATPDPWAALRRHTMARIALGRAGASLPTAEWLRFALAHAQARDAVHLPFDAPLLARELAARGVPVRTVHSAAADRAAYLRRPDLGRRLADGAAAALTADPVPAPWCASGADLAVVLADGLSARAVHTQALPLLDALLPLLQGEGLRLAPVVLAQQARVALGDAVGAALAARAVLVLIGERPGLSSPDSLGAYLTWAPQPGRSDAERNCVSNIRPEGLAHAAAARKLAWLLGAARRLGATGVVLKDESDGLLAAPQPAAGALPASD